ncbi:MAG: hypothetical protein K2G36_04505 [Ruminococcus sp.]|nr:hypothetical protein [Ruminococcus sp.]
MTNERMQELVDFLSSDPDRMTELFQMDAEMACEEINAEGYDFTAEELREFGQAISTAVVRSNSGELSEDDLEQVSGGSCEANFNMKYTLSKNFQCDMKITYSPSNKWTFSAGVTWTF